tara:strand:+ start:2284 stop:3270 length:987 start_codon:yes stop_codon:yes gene_type:complete
MLSIKQLFLLSLLLIVACTSKNQQEKKVPKKVHVKINIPEFNADSAYHYIQKQVDFGPRYLSSEGWKKCVVWLEKKFLQYTPNVVVQEASTITYDGKKHTLKNIITSFSPENNNRIALFAHWDTRPIADHDTNDKDKPILGANDGGSGVGVLLELARQFSKKKPKIGIDIILFDAEDYGQPENSKYPIMQDSWCLGAQHWGKNPHKQNYYARYGILLDMVGGKNATFYHEQLSAYFAPNILKKVWGKAHQLGYGRHFIYENSPQIMDDHYYVNTLTSIPTIDIIEFDPVTENHFNKHWHTHGDDMKNIDKSTLKAVGQTLMEVIYKEL